MYSIYAYIGLNSETAELVYDPTRVEEGYVITAGSFINRIDSAGEASFTIPPSHPLYNSLHKIKTHIVIKEDDRVVWYGRVFSTRRDFRNCKVVTCEGAMAFLNDICLAPYRYYVKNPKYGQPDEPEYIIEPKSKADHIEYIMDVYNTRCHKSRKINFGTSGVEFHVGEIIEGCDSYDTVLTELKNMIGDYNYHFVTTCNGSDGRPSVTITAEKLPTYKCTQAIEFGKNLLDFEEYLNAESAYGCIIPLGEGDASCYDDNGKEPIESLVPLKDRAYYVSGNTSDYGPIDRVINFTGLSKPSELAAAAQKVFELGGGDPAVEFTIKAIDLHMLDVSVEEFKIGYAVTVISTPHKINKDFIISEISINMLQPDNNSYTFCDTNMQSPETIVDQYCNLKLRTVNELWKKVTTGQNYGIVSIENDKVNLVLELPISNEDIKE